MTENPHLIRLRAHLDPFPELDYRARAHQLIAEGKGDTTIHDLITSHTPAVARRNRYNTYTPTDTGVRRSVSNYVTNAYGGDPALVDAVCESLAPANVMNLNTSVAFACEGLLDTPDALLVYCVTRYRRVVDQVIDALDHVAKLPSAMTVGAGASADFFRGFLTVTADEKADAA